MPVLYFHVLSLRDAEDAVAETWSTLEEYGIPSPRMTCTFRGGSRVKISLRVDDPVDMQTLTLRLAQWVQSQTGGTAPARETLPTQCPHVPVPSAASPRSLVAAHDRRRRSQTAARLCHSALLIAGYYSFFPNAMS